MGAASGESRWELEIGGIRLALATEPIVLGRDPACDLPLNDERVSWRHLRIEIENGTPLLTDLGSSNGTYVEGRRIDSDPRSVSRETIVQLGGTRARIRENPAEPSAARGQFRRIALRAQPVRIGRAPDNDVVLDEPNVSWHHAEVRPGSPPTLHDLGSRNGVRLGNQLLQASGDLYSGVPAGIGPFGLRVDGDELVVVDERGGLSLAADAVSVRVGSLRILHPTSISVAPGEFLALIGPSGSGKTTLLKCLAGVTEPTAGTVLVGTDPLELRLTEVGYVPQSDVAHSGLTVDEALLCAARLRLPSDTRRDEHAMAVETVLEELRLLDHRQTLIGDLSGGQRKRVACGVELIGRPTMLLLDEPTSGLDPALERRLMTTFRRLADSGRGIVVVTHATSSLSLCDTVAVMAPGGHLLHTGSPAESIAHFGVAAYDEIYNALDLVETPELVEPVISERRSHARARLLSGRSLVKHGTALTGRYARTLRRDRRTLAILLGQAPIMALLIALLYPAHVLARPDSQPARSAQFVFLLITAALWLGLIDACREIVKERSIIGRELAVGVRLDAYLLSKASLLFLLAVMQCVLLLSVATAIQPLHEQPGSYLTLGLLLVLTSWSTIGIGLVVSALARSMDQATSLIPLLLIPQLLFGAALVPFARMSTVVKGLSDVMVSRWSFAGAGHAVGMNARLVEAPQVSAISGYGTSFFSLSAGASAIIMLGFTAAMLLSVAILLSRGANRSA